MTHMLTILAIPAADFGPHFVGELVLLTVAAVFVGFGTFKMLPDKMNPKLFAVMVPFLVLGTLAYLGSYAAATAVVLFVVLAIGAVSLGLS